MSDEMICPECGHKEIWCLYVERVVRKVSMIDNGVINGVEGMGEVIRVIDCDLKHIDCPKCYASWDSVNSYLLSCGEIQFNSRDYVYAHNDGWCFSQDFQPLFQSCAKNNNNIEKVFASCGIIDEEHDNLKFDSESDCCWIYTKHESDMRGLIHRLNSYLKLRMEGING